MKDFLVFFVYLRPKIDIIEPKTEVTMDFQYKLDYSKLSDKQIVEKILAVPHDEEAAAYLLHDRYAPLLQKVYYSFTNDGTWYDDCVDELFIYVRGKDNSWHALAGFEWRSTLGYWLKKVARSRFQNILPKLIENGGRNISIDNDDSEKTKVQIPDGGVESYELRIRKVMLMEAIGFLKDDEKFVIMKRIQGYNSEEIAELLGKKWKEQNIVKYNHDGELVVANVEYVNSKAQKARKNLKKIMVEPK